MVNSSAISSESELLTRGSVDLNGNSSNVTVWLASGCAQNGILQQVIRNMTGSVIDLCSDSDECTASDSHPIVIRFRQDADGVIELLSDSDDQSDMPACIRPIVRNPYKKASKRVRNDMVVSRKSKVKMENELLKPDKSVSSIVVDAELCVVDAIPSFAKPLDEGDCGDNECWIVGQKGFNALSDFPHSREDCVVHPIINNAELHCPKCFCYVCDVRVAECRNWKVHCSARFQDSYWKAERFRRRLQADQNKPRLMSCPPTTHPRRNIPLPPRRRDRVADTANYRPKSRTPDVDNSRRRSRRLADATATRSLGSRASNPPPQPSPTCRRSSDAPATIPLIPLQPAAIPCWMNSSRKVDV